MLDKSIPYKNILMRADAFSPTFAFRLPEGYGIRLYTPGDEREWAAVEASVGEFDSPAEAEAYFARTFLPYQGQARRRCFFILAPGNVYAGTCTAWFMSLETQKPGMVHWFAVRPEYQGLGLGKALLGKVMRFFQADGAFPVYLHTQTWSHKAVGLYHEAGFRILKTGTFQDAANDYPEAMEVLRQVVPPQRLQAWMDGAVCL